MTTATKNVEWLDRVTMGLVMAIQSNAPDKEYLNYKGYTFYQDEWEPCAGWIRNRNGETIASWNMYKNTFSGTEEDKDVIVELWSKTYSEQGYKLPELAPTLPKRRVVKETEVSEGDMTIVFVPIGILVILLMFTISLLL